MSAPYQTVLWAAMLLAAAGSAKVQASSASASKGSAPAAAASAAPASGTSNPLTYRSVFDGYRPFSDQPVVSWREANDLVGRIGGWRAYAREGQGDPGRSPAQPASGAGGHSGHHGP